MLSHLPCLLSSLVMFFFSNLVAMGMSALGEPKCYIINPVVGVSVYFSTKLRYLQCIHVQPEPITGSSRMKSGSVTKIILETLFILSMNKIMEAESSQW